MQLPEQQRQSDSSWLLQMRDLAPEEFATYLLELGTLALRRRLVAPATSHSRQSKR
ncbi:hypothetical protein [Pseudomonas fluorescens]|uniref:hypothetical protein n=1 Tax=Pseudomonas fluorescens TaxID=294 RepID=UPI0012540CD8|nr:hypothetical protein [Pseudomonas fluorescens]CAG8863977.1 hypothetical protein PS861_00111 [Pseudomonas fluorescens]